MTPLEQDAWAGFIIGLMLGIILICLVIPRDKR